MFGALRNRRALRDARRYNSRYRRASSPVDDALVERDYVVTCALGGFGNVKIPWGGTSLEDARDSFLEYIGNHALFDELHDERYAKWRSVHVKFNGQSRLLTFRTDWIAGFTVH